MNQKIIFVYNADSSPFALLTDYVHKIVSPQTYECNLCALTYGNLGMKKRWKDFVESLKDEVVFLHKDELIKQHPSLASTALPTILCQKDKDKTPSVCVSEKQINAAKSLDELQSLVRAINK